MKLQLNLALAEKFFDQCERLGITGPPTIAKAREAIAVAESHQLDPAPADTLQMTPAEIRAFVEGRAIRRHVTTSHGTGLAAGLAAFRDQVNRDVIAAVFPQLDDIVDQLRPRFAELSAPLEAAVRDYGFSLTTSSDDIINMESDAATAAWRSARRAWEAIAPIVALRKQMNEVFDLRPNVDDLPPRRHMSMTPNISVLFASGDNWSLGEKYLAGTSNSLDWFALARDGLRLNSPSEVGAKLAARDIAERRAREADAAATAKQRETDAAETLRRLSDEVSTGRIAIAR